MNFLVAQILTLHAGLILTSSFLDHLRLSGINNRDNAQRAYDIYFNRTISVPTLIRTLENGINSVLSDEYTKVALLEEERHPNSNVLYPGVKVILRASKRSKQAELFIEVSFKCADYPYSPHNWYVPDIILQKFEKKELECTPEIYLHQIEMISELRGKGIATNLINNLIEISNKGACNDSMPYIKLIAQSLPARDYDGASYWAHAGFSFYSQKSAENVKNDFFKWLRGKYGFPMNVFQPVKINDDEVKIIENHIKKNVKEPKQLLEFNTREIIGKDVALGKEFLSGRDYEWIGKFDCRPSSKNIAVFRNRCSKRFGRISMNKLYV